MKSTVHLKRMVISMLFKCSFLRTLGYLMMLQPNIILINLYLHAHEFFTSCKCVQSLMCCVRFTVMYAFYISFRQTVTPFADSFLTFALTYMLHK